jgi:hypothetical protein
MSAPELRCCATSRWTFVETIRCVPSDSRHNRDTGALASLRRVNKCAAAHNLLALFSLTLRTSRCRPEPWHGSLASCRTLRAPTEGRACSCWSCDAQAASFSAALHFYVSAVAVAHVGGRQKIHSQMPRLLASRQRPLLLALGYAANQALASCRLDLLRITNDVVDSWRTVT